MSVRPIIMWPEPWLSEKSDPVLPEEFNSDQLKEIVQDLVDTMNQCGGLGLSAPQLGVHKRIITVRDFPKPPDEPKPLVVCNPVLSDFSEEKQSGVEGCLSLPGVRVPRERALRVKVTGKLVDGSDFSEVAEGLRAVAIQHEYDHLEGKTIADDAGPVRRDMIKRKLDKFIRDREREEEKRKKNLEIRAAEKADQTDPEDYTVPRLSSLKRGLDNL